MKYTREAIKYISKNFFYVFPFAVLPAMFLALAVDERAVAEVLGCIFRGEFDLLTFGKVFHAISVVNFGSWRAVLFGIVGIIVLTPCVAMLTALLEKHFRIGKRTFNGVWSKLNDNALSTIGYVLFLLVVYEIWSLILSALICFAALIRLRAVAYVFMAIFVVALHFILVYLIGTIYLWLPCMQITGFRPYEALRYAYALIAPSQWKLLGNRFFTLLIVETLIAVFSVWLPLPVAFVLIAAVYTLLILLYCVRMQIVYFDLDQIERADLTRFY